MSFIIALPLIHLPETSVHVSDMVVVCVGGWVGGTASSFKDCVFCSNPALAGILFFSHLQSGFTATCITYHIRSHCFRAHMPKQCHVWMKWWVCDIFDRLSGEERLSSLNPLPTGKEKKRQSKTSGNGQQCCDVHFLRGGGGGHGVNYPPKCTPYVVILNLSASVI